MRERKRARERESGGDFVRVLSMTRLLDMYGNEKRTYTAAVMCATVDLVHTNNIVQNSTIQVYMTRQ